MSTSLERVVETLEQAPAGTCDDCLSISAQVKPRQQVNQICRHLAHLGVVERTRRACSLCHTEKLVNRVADPSLRKKARTPRVEQPKQARSVSDVPARLDQIRRRMVEILNRIEKHSNKYEGFSLRTSRLRESGKLPSSVGCMMLTLNSLRNLVVYEGFSPGRHELAVIEAAWSAIAEWEQRSDLL